MRYDIFISYSRKDSAIVERYYDYLIAAGLSVWLDKDGIETGDEFKKKIVHAIKDSDVFLFFSSVNSNTSPWTVKEVNVAVNYKKKIIPVKLDITPYEESIMFDLAGLDFFDHANNGFEIGVGKLLAAFGKNYYKIVEDVKKEAIRRKNEQERLHKETILNQKGVVETRIQNRKKNDGWKWECIIAAISIFVIIIFFLINNGGEDSTYESSNYVSGDNDYASEEYDYTAEKKDYVAEREDCGGEDDVTIENKNDFSSTCIIMIGGHEAVDLGLPSGTKWATCNIGANRPEDYGDYYAWGETETKSSYDRDNSEWVGEYYSTLRKDNIIDSESNIDCIYDVAYQKWGSQWHLPTYDQIKELKKYTTTEWTTQNGVNGILVKSNKNKNTLFLPAAGYRDGRSKHQVGSYGYYWSVTTESTDWSAYAICVDVSFGINPHSGIRSAGYSVRPVTE